MTWPFAKTLRPSRSISSKTAHISTIFVPEGGLSRGGVVFTCLSLIKKAKQPPPSFPSAPSARSFVRALVPACSYAPAPVPHPRVFGSPSAHDSLLRFFVRTSALAPSPRVLSARPGPVRRMVPSVRPRTRPFAMSQPRFALSQFRLPRVSFLSRSLGSLAPVFSTRPSIYPGPLRSAPVP